MPPSPVCGRTGSCFGPEPPRARVEGPRLRPSLRCGGWLGRRPRPRGPVQSRPVWSVGIWSEWWSVFWCSMARPARRAHRPKALETVPQSGLDTRNDVPLGTRPGGPPRSKSSWKPTKSASRNSKRSVSAFRGTEHEYPVPCVRGRVTYSPTISDSSVDTHLERDVVERQTVGFSRNSKRGCIGEVP
jgi:hypothetical protein